VVEGTALPCLKLGLGIVVRTGPPALLSLKLGLGLGVSSGDCGRADGFGEIPPPALPGLKLGLSVVVCGASGSGVIIEGTLPLDLRSLWVGLGVGRGGSSSALPKGGGDVDLGTKQPGADFFELVLQRTFFTPSSCGG